MTEIQKMIMSLGERMVALETTMGLILWVLAGIGGMISLYFSTKITIHFRNGKKK